MNKVVVWKKPNPSAQEQVVIDLLQKHFEPAPELSEEAIEAAYAAYVASYAPGEHCLNAIREAAARLDQVHFFSRHSQGLQLRQR